MELDRQQARTINHDHASGFSSVTQANQLTARELPCAKRPPPYPPLIPANALTTFLWSGQSCDLCECLSGSHLIQPVIVSRLSLPPTESASKIWCQKRAENVKARWRPLASQQRTAPALTYLGYFIKTDLNARLKLNNSSKRDYYFVAKKHNMHMKLSRSKKGRKKTQHTHFRSYPL